MEQDASEVGDATSTGAAWKIPLLALVFLATLLPYAIAVLFTSPLDLVSFILAWVLFFWLRSVIPGRISLYTSLACGFLLAFPPSTYLTIVNGRVYFHFDYINGALPRLVFFLLLMSAAHSLASCIRWVRP